MKIAQKAEELFDLPEGMLSGEARLEIEGHTRLCAQGGASIISYDDEAVRLMTRAGEIRVSGDGLMLECFHESSICVSGRLLSVEFL